MTLSYPTKLKDIVQTAPTLTIIVIVFAEAGNISIILPEYKLLSQIMSFARCLPYIVTILQSLNSHEIIQKRTSFSFKLFMPFPP